MNPENPQKFFPNIFGNFTRNPFMYLGVRFDLETEINSTIQEFRNAE